MSVLEIVIILLATLILFSIIHKIDKNKKPVRRAFVSMLTGVVSLFIVNVTGFFTGVYLPVSVLSMIISLVFGIPGVTMLLTLNLFF